MKLFKIKSTLFTQFSSKIEQDIRKQKIIESVNNVSVIDEAQWFKILDKLYKGKDIKIAEFFYKIAFSYIHLRKEYESNEKEKVTKFVKILAPTSIQNCLKIIKAQNKITQEISDLKGNAIIARAEMYLLDGSFEQALICCEQYLTTISEENIVQNPVIYAKILVIMACIYGNLGDKEKAIFLLEAVKGYKETYKYKDNNNKKYDYNINITKYLKYYNYYFEEDLSKLNKSIKLGKIELIDPIHFLTTPIDLKFYQVKEIIIKHNLAYFSLFTHKNLLYYIKNAIKKEKWLEDEKKNGAKDYIDQYLKQILSKYIKDKEDITEEIKLGKMLILESMCLTLISCKKENEKSNIVQVIKYFVLSEPELVMYMLDHYPNLFTFKGSGIDIVGSLIRSTTKPGEELIKKLPDMMQDLTSMLEKLLKDDISTIVSSIKFNNLQNNEKDINKVKKELNEIKKVQKIKKELDDIQKIQQQIIKIYGKSELLFDSKADKVLKLITQIEKGIEIMKEVLLLITQQFELIKQKWKIKYGTKKSEKIENDPKLEKEIEKNNKTIREKKDKITSFIIEIQTSQKESDDDVQLDNKDLLTITLTEYTDKNDDEVSSSGDSTDNEEEI